MKAAKRLIPALLTLLLLAGCGNSAETPVTTTPEASPAEPTLVVSPLPNTTMDNLTDAILSVSFEKDGVYVDDSGILQMDVKVYAYDQYDMVDISMLDVGAAIITHSGEVAVTSLDRMDDGTILINGGYEKDGIALVTNDGGIFYESTGNDAKNWYEVGETTLRVSVDFQGHDNADPAKGEVLIYPGDFVTDAVSNYDFTPHNSTIRVENGQVVELNRWHIPE